MKKTILFALQLTFAFSVNGQSNLVSNQGFEEWSNDKPTQWNIGGVGRIISAEQTTIFEQTKSLKMDATIASESVYSYQYIPVTPGKTYTLSLSYYIVSGDNTDARIWCSFKNNTTDFSEAELISTGLYPVLRGPGSKKSTDSNYFPDEKGVWKSYTTDFCVPSNATSFRFEFRSYPGAIVLWDMASLTEKTITSQTSKPISNKISIKTQNNKLIISSNEFTVIEIYTLSGTKIKKLQIHNNYEITLANGIYFVQYDGKFHKIVL